MTSNHQVSHTDPPEIPTGAHQADDAQSFTPSMISRSSLAASLSGSTEISQEHIDHIHDAFAVFDKEMTGSITTEQFR